MSLYSVVVPVYNSEHTLGELYTRLVSVGFIIIIISLGS